VNCFAQGCCHREDLGQPLPAGNGGLRMLPARYDNARTRRASSLQIMKIA
jgi:hypothetical protein